jgi:hypothetical protein
MSAVPLYSAEMQIRRPSTDTTQISCLPDLQCHQLYSYFPGQHEREGSLTYSRHCMHYVSAVTWREEGPTRVRSEKKRNSPHYLSRIITIKRRNCIVTAATLKGRLRNKKQTANNRERKCIQRRLDRMQKREIFKNICATCSHNETRVRRVTRSFN